MLSESFTRGRWIWAAELVLILFLEMTKAVCDDFLLTIFHQERQQRDIKVRSNSDLSLRSVDVLLFVKVGVFCWIFLVYIHASKLVNS